MGGRFGKYGDAKRKAKIREKRLRPPVAKQRGKDKSVKAVHRRKARHDVQRGDS